MNKTKLDLNKSVIDLDGNEIPNSNLGKILAQNLANTNKGEAVKFWAIAVELHKVGGIELDDSDYAVIKDFVVKNENFTNIVKAQLLQNFTK